MSIGLHNLKPHPGSVHRRKRLGRGLGSGHGTFSTRGTKGQRARTGGTAGIAQRALRSLILRLPKFKGMPRSRPHFRTVTTQQLAARFPAGSAVDGRVLVAVGLIATDRAGVKILAAGTLTKALTVTANAFSQAARAQIEQAGGKVIQKQ